MIIRAAVRVRIKAPAATLHQGDGSSVRVSSASREIGEVEMQTPDFHPAFVYETTSAYVAPGRFPDSFKPGDVILGRAHRGFRRWVIAFGQGIRIHGRDRCFIDYTHAALVVDDEGGLVEAVGGGVEKSSLGEYASRRQAYRIVDIKASEEDRDEVVAFAKWALDYRLPYNRVATVSIFFSQLTGSKFAFFIDGEFHCSGLVAKALERSQALFTKDPVHIMPADLAKYLQAPPADWAPSRRKRRYDPRPVVEPVLATPRAPSVRAPLVNGRRAFGTRSTSGTRRSWWRGTDASPLRSWLRRRPRLARPAAPGV